MESQAAWDGEAGLPRRREPGLAGLAAFSLDGSGRIISWPVTAATLFGLTAAEVAGRDLCDVLMTGPGQRELVRHALSQVAAGQVWSATVAGGSLGAGRFAIRFEPLTGGPGEAMVVVQRAWPQSAPDWLGAAATVIGSTLDISQTAAEVAAVAVPGFSDAVAIYGAERLLTGDELTTPQGSREAVVRRLAARLRDRPDSDTERLLRPGEVLIFGAETPNSQAMATGEPVLFDQLDSESTVRLSRHPGGREVISGYSFFLAVPLIARGAVVGCAVFARMPASPAFSPGDIVLAQELASRAAVCIDNARLYHRERRTAQALQRGLLPGRPRVPPGIEVAQCYVPVGASVVGGDWHDIVPLAGGGAALIVGDAMGHGPEAAAVMVQLRTAAHTLADLEVPPAEALRRLDRMAAEMPAALFATCLYTVLNPEGSTCVAAQAGHLPPVLISADGDTELLALPPGLPLGLGEDYFEATEISLPPGATLALYTDGLVESRARPLDEGLAALRYELGAALTTPGTTLSSVCDTVTKVLREHGEDDLTLVLARIRE